ncbi:hypothetical protein [Haloarchaeobius sp. FL176]|uniref:hypothetical protein n=1 Tax=Haloarchaeobius sp. FL176 TaxID=2967129 RepID=UPI0021483894|nr:hypothetical protein [Haloarchaeobius sp. FL176]
MRDTLLDRATVPLFVDAFEASMYRVAITLLTAFGASAPGYADVPSRSRWQSGSEERRSSRCSSPDR